MTVQTHVSFALMSGAALWIPYSIYQSPTIMDFTMYIGAVAIGSVFPDIDEPESYIGRKTIIISNIVKKLFGHRGMTHSLFFAIFVFTILFVVNMINFENKYLFFVYGFSIGWFFHSIGDMFTIGGVPILLPFKKKKYHVLPKIMRLYTGSFTERIILNPVFFLIFLLELVIILNKQYNLIQLPFFI